MELVAAAASLRVLALGVGCVVVLLLSAVVVAGAGRRSAD